MINGVNLSQIASVQGNKHGHIKRLSYIHNHQTPGFTFLDRSLVDIFRHRKVCHQQWRRFKTSCTYNNNQRAGQESQSTKYQSKRKDLENQIWEKQVQFQCKGSQIATQDSFHETKGLHYFKRKKVEEQIDRQNPQIAKRIIKAHGSIDMGTRSGFMQSRKTVNRLQKFPMVRRMMIYSQNKIKEGKYLKTQGCSNRTKYMTLVKFQ